jgi:hypothetical protein
MTKQTKGIMEYNQELDMKLSNTLALKRKHDLRNEHEINS